MTTETFTPASPYTISGTGPYAIPFEYSDQLDIRAEVVDGDTVTLLTTSSYTISPTTYAASGNLTLTSGAAATHAGKTLSITRATRLEQGWVGNQTSREKGLERQVDINTRHGQDIERFLKRVPRLPLLATLLEPLLPDPVVGAVLIGTPSGWEHGPTLDSLVTIPTAAKEFTSFANLKVYNGPALVIGTTVRTLQEGFAYSVVSSGEHMTTVGGDKLRLRPGPDGSYNPLAIGVDNTGVSDCSALIDTLDALGPLSFPEGTYIINAAISQSHSWRAVGDVTLKLKDGAVFANGAIEVVSPFVACTGFKVNGNRSGGAQAQKIWYSDQVGTMFNNLNVTGIWKDAIQFWGDYTRAFQCRVEFDADSGQSGIEAIAGVNSDYSTIDSCIILNGVDDCISFHVANGCAMTNNYCHNLYGKGACIGLAGKCFDIDISNNICIAAGTGATGASMIRVATEDSAAFANVADGLRINTRDNNLYLVAGASRDYGIRYQGNGGGSQIAGNVITSDGTMLIGIEVLEHTVAATLYTPTEVDVIGNTVDGAATGIKAITATGSKIEGNTIKNATLGLWSQVVGSLDDSNHFLSCTTPFNIGGNGRVFSAWESERFCNLARPATGSIDLALNPGGTIRTKTAQGKICIIGMTAQVSALPSANNLNAILYADVGSGLATVTGATIQFNSGTAAWIQDWVAAAYPAIVDAGDTFKVETTTSGSITVTPEMIVDVHYVKVRAI